MNSPVSQVLNVPDILRHILLQADYNTIINYCRSYVQAQNMCRDEIFWIQKAQQDFNILPNEFRETTLSPAMRYLQLLTKNGGLEIGSEQFIKEDEFMKRAIHQNRSDLIRYILDLGFNHWDVPLEEYAILGNRQQVGYYLQLYKDYNVAAYGALKGDHGELFDYIKSLAPQNYNWNWNSLLSGALRSENIALFDYIGKSLPPNYRFIHQEFADDALSLGNKQMFDFIRSLAPPDYPWIWNELGQIAAKTGNQQLFDYIHSLIPPIII